MRQKGRLLVLRRGKHKRTTVRTTDCRERAGDLAAVKWLARWNLSACSAVPAWKPRPNYAINCVA